MGSDSDLPVMQAAAATLEEFGVPFELTVVSAHRTPRRLVEYASTARARGLRVIIAAAGGAAHLPGMVAALTPLPVIGVPVALKQLDGVDSLYSIVQMPRGVPVRKEAGLCRPLYAAASACARAHIRALTTPHHVVTPLPPLSRVRARARAARAGGHGGHQQLYERRAACHPPARRVYPVAW
jgi:phosphoribosylaminoimidazole carboxylase PurE protein